MKKYTRMLWLLLSVFLICSCRPKPVPPPPVVPVLKYKYEKDAIHLNLRSDLKLNFYEGMPHTLQVCVYQLKDPNAFNQYANDEDGLYQLLECSLFDVAALSSKRLTLHPGQDLEVSLDRAEEAKYVAVVAGYYQVRKEGITRLFEIPVVEKTMGAKNEITYQEIGLLDIELVLGPQQIHSSHSEVGKSAEEKAAEEKSGKEKSGKGK
jgi:type VI secretion system VasD/TssJ family lipoprotein